MIFSNLHEIPVGEDVISIHNSALFLIQKQLKFTRLGLQAAVWSIQHLQMLPFSAVEELLGSFEEELFTWHSDEFSAKEDL
jgi:hypothetical protein